MDAERGRGRKGKCSLTSSLLRLLDEVLLGFIGVYFKCDLCFVLICLARLSGLERFLWHSGHSNRAV